MHMLKDKRREEHDGKRNKENRQRARSWSIFERLNQVESCTESFVHKSRKISHSEQQKISTGLK